MIAPSIYAIQRAVCEHYDIALVDMMSRRRDRSIARPRQIAMYLAGCITLRSLPEIGRCFDRDHTTVMHAVHAINCLRQRDAATNAAIKAIVDALPKQEEKVTDQLSYHAGYIAGYRAALRTEARP